jgi:hypothetical protein
MEGVGVVGLRGRWVGLGKMVKQIDSVPMNFSLHAQLYTLLFEQVEFDRR